MRNPGSRAVINANRRWQRADAESRGVLSSLPETGKGSSGLRRLSLGDLPRLWHALGARRRIGYRLTVLAAAFLFASCTKPAPKQTPAIGVAYTGPSTLNIRKDLGTRAQTVATAKHGDRL